MKVINSNKPGFEGGLEISKKIARTFFPDMPEEFLVAFVNFLGPDIYEISDEEFEQRMKNAFEDPELLKLAQNYLPYIQGLVPKIPD